MKDTSLCYILHSYPYQENSLILQCLSLERGLIRILSKGARSSKKNLLSLLQPFQLLSISYVGKSDLLILTGVELSITSEVENYSVASGEKPLLSGQSVYCAYYVNELYMRLLIAEEANTQLFALYQRTIENLYQKDTLELTLRIFEINFLHLLGYQPNLEHDILSGNKISKNSKYYFDAVSGAYEVNTTLTKVNTKNCIVSGKTLLAIKSHNFTQQQTLKESKLLFRHLLLYLLGDKPLKSREVYKQLYGA